jgi:hypothetical protein
MVMWFTRSIDESREQRQRDAVIALERQNATLQTSVQWLQATVNQLQAERAILLERVLGLNLPVPTIVQTPGTPESARHNQRTQRHVDEPAEPFDLVAAFEDMGDEDAKKHGVDLTPDGFVTYSGTR